MSINREYIAIYCNILQFKNSKNNGQKNCFQNYDARFLLIGVFRVYSRSFIAKLAKTKKSISSETNPTRRYSTTNYKTRTTVVYHVYRTGVD